MTMLRGTGGGARLSLGVALLGLLATACGGGGGGGSSPTGPTTVSGPSTPPGFDFGSNNALRASAFGDSITFGVLELRKVSSGLSTGSNYPNILQSMLQGLDPAWRVVNRGRSGELTGQGLGRIGSVLASDHPGFILIMEGTNDASDGISPGSIVGNLEAMVGAAQANRTVPVIGTIPPNFRNDPGAIAIVDEANRGIRALASARGIVLADIFNGMNDRTLFGQGPDRDPLHPNERGYAVMAGIWFSAMQKAIPKPVVVVAPPAPTPDPSGSGVGLKKKR